MSFFQLTSYILLLCAVVSIVTCIGSRWKIQLWYFPFALSVLFAFPAGILTLTSFCYVIILGVVGYFYRKKKSGWLAIVFAALSLILTFHFPVLGFHNYKFLDKIRITPDAIPYSMYFNYDKTLIAVFFLGFAQEYLNRKAWLYVFTQAGKYFLLLGMLILGLSVYIGYVHFEPKFPSFAPVWMLVNLFFVCTAEETLYRGVIQQELSVRLKIPHKNLWAILIASVLFGLRHYAGGTMYILLAAFAGLFYGHIYNKTKQLRSSILLHFLLNCGHFLFFTYPAIQH